MKQLYMIEFELPEILAHDFENLLIAQQQQIEELQGKGQVQTYFSCRKQSKLWMVAIAESEFEVLALIEQLPLSNVMIPSITELMQKQSATKMLVAALN